MTEEERAAVIRECIEALPVAPLPFGERDMEAIGYFDGVNECHDALSAMLPKPNAVPNLVKEWNDDLGYTEDWQVLRDVESFARWLIDTGRLKL